MGGIFLLVTIICGNQFNNSYYYNRYRCPLKNKRKCNSSMKRSISKNKWSNRKSINRRRDGYIWKRAMNLNRNKNKNSIKNSNYNTLRNNGKVSKVPYPKTNNYENKNINEANDIYINKIYKSDRNKNEKKDIHMKSEINRIDKVKDKVKVKDREEVKVKNKVNVEEKASIEDLLEFVQENIEVNNDKKENDLLVCECNSIEEYRNVGEIINKEYKGVNLEVILGGTAIIEGEVILNLSNIVAIKTEDNRTIYINEKYILGFY